VHKTAHTKEEQLTLNSELMMATGPRGREGEVLRLN
jgi:hypothetical protein